MVESSNQSGELAAIAEAFMPAWLGMAALSQSRRCCRWAVGSSAMMSRHTTFKYCLDATVEQREVLARHAGASRFAFNQSLRMVKTALSDRRGDPNIEVPWTGFDLINAFNGWKKAEAAGRVFTVDTAGTAQRLVTGLTWRAQVFQQVFEEAAVDLGRGLKAAQAIRLRPKAGSWRGPPHVPGDPTNSGPPIQLEPRDSAVRRWRLLELLVEHALEVAGRTSVLGRVRHVLAVAVLCLEAAAGVVVTGDGRAEQPHRDDAGRRGENPRNCVTDCNDFSGHD